MNAHSNSLMESAIQPVEVLVRYNTRQDNQNPASWRVLISDESSSQQFNERFAMNVVIKVPSHTSEDVIAPGVMKWHLRARGYVNWIGDVCYVSDIPEIRPD